MKQQQTITWIKGSVPKDNFQDGQKILIKFADKSSYPLFVYADDGEVKGFFKHEVVGYKFPKIEYRALFEPPDFTERAPADERKVPIYYNRDKSAGNSGYVPHNEDLAPGHGIESSGGPYPQYAHIYENEAEFITPKEARRLIEKYRREWLLAEKFPELFPEIF